MKVVYSGGFDKYVRESVQKGIFYRYADAINRQLDRGKVVASINFAKPDSYYDSRLDEIYGGRVLSIDKRNEATIDWSTYDIIFIPGGNQRWLKETLIESNFSVDKLKKSVVVISDSAGAYLMSAYFVRYDVELDDIDDLDLKELVDTGFYTSSHVITLAHVNNKRYVSDKVLEVTKSIADKLGARFVALEENEEKTLDENLNIVTVDVDELFSD